MRIIDTTCRNCGANLHIDADCQSAYCEYCGAQLLIDDEVQHLQIDNAESAGYAFEKGRQRAQNERYYFAHPHPVPKKKSSKMVWWVLGWIFIFPVPLTIIISRNKKLRTGVKVAIIIAAWLVYILIGIVGGAVDKQNNREKSFAAQTSCLMYSFA